MFEEKEFKRRRDIFFALLPSASVAILVGNKECHRNGDAEYPFRQDSDFFYLTGITEPETIAVFIKDKQSSSYILFNRDKNKELELWTGPRIGQNDACKIYGASAGFSITEFKKKLPELLTNRERIYYSIGKNLQWDNELISCAKELHKKTRSGIKSPEEFINVESILHEMRLKKSPFEINLMRKSAEISADAHIRAMKAARPGIKEYQLEAELLYEFTRQGARAPAYTSIVGAGANSCILHYIANNSVIRENDLVLIDAGAEYEYYAADITRSFPASGQFSPQQKAIYEIVLSAQLSVIELVKPGCPWNTLQEKAVEVISTGLLELGILKGKLSDILSMHSYGSFYMHNIGHWLGLDVHDVGNYKVNDKWRVLEPGMVLTIEPGIYISSEAKVANRWKNIGIRIEDDVLVTETGFDVLSKKVPKNPDEIEALIRK